MRDLDAFPKRHASHELADEAVRAFKEALDPSLWLVQESIRHDYGVDVRLELVEEGSPTNFSVWVQLKGTDTAPNVDGSVSISNVATTNLNYLLSQPHSTYICYHRPTQRLLIRSADDVHRRPVPSSDSSTTITVRFYESLDRDVMERLHRQVAAGCRARRDERLLWEAEPRQAPTLVHRRAPVHVCGEPARALDQLNTLFEAGCDRSISDAFEQFAAVLPGFLDGLYLAYMAEINLGLNCREGVDGDRIRTAKALFASALAAGQLEPATAHYTLGNAHLALEEYEAAKSRYELAAGLLADRPRVLAQCHKNRGAALRGLGADDESARAYEAALAVDPDLAEAHYALALVLRAQGRLDDSLGHLDEVLARRNSALDPTAVMGWRAELFLRLGRFREGFREIHSLVAMPAAASWAWSWSARIVAENLAPSLDAHTSALKFWRAYIETHPESPFALEQLFRGAYFLKMNGGTPQITFDQFAGTAAKLIEHESDTAGPIWDRVGHWAQVDGDWQAAEHAFRAAFGRNEDFACCLATALNHLDQYDEAADLLDRFVERHPDDDVGHYQRAVAAARTKDHVRAEAEYRRVLELNPSYELAMFNLGGELWNQRRFAEGAAVWREAIERYPEHPLAEKLQRDLPALFGRADAPDTR